MSYDTTIERERTERIVNHVRPEWELHGATPAEGGQHAVCHLDVGTPEGRRRCVLKATPPGMDPVCGDEARITRVIERHTTVPVPAVQGVIDDHPEFPTPLFLAADVPGENPHRTDGVELPEARVRTVARSTGRHLADLHALDAVDGFGFVGVEDGATLEGGRPAGDRGALLVESPVDSWTDYLADAVDGVLVRIEDTRFSDLRPTLQSTVFDLIDRLDGPRDPVLCRIDNSIDNLILESTGEVAAMLDWEFALAATPAYDLAFVAHSLAGGHWARIPGVGDHREAVREELFAGYREVGPERPVERYRRHERLYQLLVAVYAMDTFETWFDLFEPGADRREAAARSFRAEVESLCDRDRAGASGEFR